MEEFPLLKDLVVIFGLSIGVLLFCHRVKIPTIVGFLLTGVICGPHALALVPVKSEVEIFARIGIILLLFTVGMEFSIRRLFEYRRFLLIGGFLQVAVTLLVVFLAADIIGRPYGESIFLGCLIALSSTAIVMRLLEERGETASPHGKVILSVLIFQDLIVVPMVLVTPLLAGEEPDLNFNFYYSIAKGLLVMAATFIGAEFLVPRLLHSIAKTRSRELFLLGVLTICATVVWVASSVGVSLSLGAFLAGLIISESEYSHEAIGDVIPFQDIFTSFFFVSMGMLLDIEFVLDHPFLVFSLAFAVMVLKSGIAGGVTLLLGMPIRTAVLAGLALCQVGEFSFVLARVGIEYKIATDYHYQLFLAVSLITMAVTPSLISLSPKIATYFFKIPLPPTLKFGLKPIVHRPESPLKEHVIIIGFGLTGKNLARAAREAQIPYTILEMDPETVNMERQRGEPIHFGDATHDSVLKHANIKKAKVVAIAVNDPLATVRILKRVRHLNPSLYVILRTGYAEQVKMMYQSGADDVIPDEFGSSIEIFTRVLYKYNVPAEEIERLVNDMRTEGYEVLRVLYREPTAFSQLRSSFSKVFTESFKVGRRAPIVDKTLRESELRSLYKVTVLLIHRGEELISNPEAEERLLAGDLVIAMGSKEQLGAAAHLFLSPHNQSHKPKKN